MAPSVGLKPWISSAAGETWTDELLRDRFEEPSVAVCLVASEALVLIVSIGWRDKTATPLYAFCVTAALS
jgi:hypothetical protein